MSFELDRIEELCNDRGWSHYRLAKEMDISPNSIGNLFRRTSIPSVPTIRHICEAMGITIRYLHGRVLQYRRQPDDLKQATEICT